MSLLPDRPVPPLSAQLAGGGVWSLSTERPQAFTLLVFYRGLHCPICRRYLAELEKLLPEFAKRGVAVIALSADTRERAEKAKADWGLNTLRVGYDIPIADLRTWGLYISKSKGPTSSGVSEPDLFGEPGLFLVRPDGRLYWVNVSSMPFARPRFDEVLAGIDFVVSKDYPARGGA